MKLAVISAAFPPMPSGGGDYVYYLCKKLAERIPNIALYTTKMDNVAQCPGVRIFPEFSTWSYSDLFHLMSRLKEFEPDVVNIHFGIAAYNNHPMILIVPYLLKTLLPKTRVVTLIEAAIPVYPASNSLFTRLLHRLFQHGLPNQVYDYGFGTILSCSDYVICLSGQQKELISSLDKRIASKITALPPPSLVPIASLSDNERTEIRTKLGADDTTILLTYFGYCYPGKGLETLLSSFAQARKQNPKLRLIIIGGIPDQVLKIINRMDYEAELKTLIKNLGIEEHVVITGGYALNDEWPSKYLQSCDLAVLPFDWGIKLSNSSVAACMANGLPMISSVNAESDKAFIHNQNIYLCEPKNVEQVVDAILLLANDKELRSKFKSGSIDISRQYYDWDKCVDKTIDVYKTNIS